MSAGHLPVRYTFRSLSECREKGGMCSASQATLRRNSLHPTRPRRHRYRKNRTSLASPGRSVLSTSNNAATDPCARCSATSSSADVRLGRLCTTLEDPVSMRRPILPEPLLIDKDFGPLL